MNEKTMFDSIEYVHKRSQFVTINLQAIENYVREFSFTKQLHWTKAYPLGYKRRLSDEEELDFLFLIGSQAFCFWGYPKKWTINYKGKKLDGWWALVACFERAIENSTPILNGDYLTQISLDDTRKLFRGKPEIPLLRERYRILKKIGQVLVQKYNGSFHHFYKKSKKEAFSLLEKLAKEFEGFDDIASYKGKKILFYKKAQVVLTDIYEVFHGKEHGAIKNIDKLPGKADYKIPDVLRKLGILEYHDSLAHKVDNKIKLKMGSEEEIEIRANTLWAIHIICESLKKRNILINPSQLDSLFWVQSQKKDKRNKHYHLAKTIYY